MGHMQKSDQALMSSTLIILRSIYQTFDRSLISSWSDSDKAFSNGELNLSVNTYHIAEQSKLTNIHLWGLKLNESARSTPAIKYRNSGQTNADPAYAASTCSHTLCSWVTTPISAKLSKLQIDVVPNVATTYRKKADHSTLEISKVELSSYSIVLSIHPIWAIA